MSVRAYLDHYPKIAANAYIDEFAVVIGDVEIGEQVSFWPCSVARGDVNHLSIGARTNVQDGAILHATHPSRFSGDGAPLIVGSDVTVGHNVVLHACEIGHHCLIGMSATVLDGVVVEPYTFIGANSLVPNNKKLTSGLWIGSPAVRVRDLKESEREFLDYSAQYYAKLAEEHRQTQLKSKIAEKAA